MNKCMMVKISVDEPTISYEKDTRWSRLELYAGKCPIPHFSSGYCFNHKEETVFEKTFRDYEYHKLSEEDAELIRIYWSHVTLEIGIGLDDIEIEIWDSNEEWPILNPDEIEIRGSE